MTPTDALHTLGWSREHLAGRLGCDPRLVHRWVREGTTPPAVAVWLAAAAAWLDANPPPIWRTRRVAEG